MVREHEPDKDRQVKREQHEAERLNSPFHSHAKKHGEHDKQCCEIEENVQKCREHRIYNYDVGRRFLSRSVMRIMCASACGVTSCGARCVEETSAAFSSKCLRSFSTSFGLSGCDSASVSSLTDGAGVSGMTTETTSGAVRGSGSSYATFSGGVMPASAAARAFFKSCCFGGS